MLVIIFVNDRPMKPAPTPTASRRRFDWNLLHTYLIVAREGSITRAAERLRLQQPTVSNALRRLEEQLGTRLIDRAPGRFELTEQGSVLYRECQEICGSIGRLDQLIADARPELEGHLHITIASHVVFPPLDAALADFHASHSQVTISIDVETSSDVEQTVLAKNATLGICLTSQPLPQLHYEQLFREHFGFFCGPSHPFFGQHDLRLQDLRSASFVSFDTDHVNDALRPVAMLRGQLEPPSRLVGVSSSLEEVKRMIVAGLGIGPLPIHVAERDVKDGLLWRLPPYEDPPSVDLFLVTNPRAQLIRAEHVFLKILQAYAETEKHAK